jgi:membrane-associated protease RseP (regulator of RpoE activity)
MNCIDHRLSHTFVIYIIDFFFTAEQQEPSVIRSSNDQTSNPRKSSSSSGKQQAPAPPTSSTIQSILPSGTRVCILQPSADRTAGFALSGKSPPPYIICQIEKNSPAEKAGLLLNDALLSINGKSVTDKSYEDTVKLVKEALQQKSVELVVQDRTKMGTQSSSIDPTKLSMDSNDSNNLGNNSSIGVEPSRQGTNAVEEYQSM